jgi:chitodextrinase
MKTPVSGSTSTAPAPLAAPTGVTATQATQSSISIAWNPSSNAAVTSYGVYKDGVKAGDTSSTAYTVSGLSCGTSYTLGVDSADSFGSRSATRTSVSASTAACPTAQPDTEAPAVPGGMLTTGATTSAISLAWNATTDNVGVAGYNLYKNGVKVGSTQSTSYTFSGLTCGTGYTLALTAYDAAGNESNAAYATTDETTSACTTPLPGDTQAPTAPSGLAVSTAGQTSIAVSWNASSDNVGVTGYSAYRNGSSAGSTSTTGYTFSGLTCGTSYTLAVDATDAAGNRSGKSTVTASTSACSSGGGGGGGTSTATVFVSPSGNDGNACSQSAPCKSFDRAYKVAKPGQVVELAGGLYPQQFVYSDSSKTSTDDVVFRPAAGATVTVDCATTSTVGGGTIGGQSCIDVYASHITFDGGSSKSLKTQTYSVSGFSYQGRVDTERGATDITFRNMDVGAYAIGSSQTTISHNDIGPSVDPLNNRQASGNANVWQDNLIHDYPIKNGGHFECVTWDGGTNITFEYNEFRSCAVYAIFAKAVDNISGSVDHNAFWNPMNLTTQADFYPSTGSGATRCDVAATNNWTSEGITLNCPGATESGNTTHDPNVQPPSPIRP